MTSMRKAFTRTRFPLAEAMSGRFTDRSIKATSAEGFGAKVKLTGPFSSTPESRPAHDVELAKFAVSRSPVEYTPGRSTRQSSRLVVLSS
jgi:hypothetical protein